MPPRNLDGHQRYARADVDRLFRRWSVGEGVTSAFRAAVEVATENVLAGYPPTEGSGSGRPAAKAVSAAGFVDPGDAIDDGVASIVLAAPESVRCTPEQDAKMQAVGQLASNVAHDFNNIFTAVLGRLQLIQRRAGDNPHVRQMVAPAIEASLRGTDLANRLLAFSCRRQLESEVFDPNTHLIGMEKVLRRTVGRRIEIDTRLMEGLWRVETDPAQLEAAILNLAINACEAMPEGGTLVIETANNAFGDAVARRPSPKTGSYVRISVRDTGCGMAPDLVERIFEPFFTTKPPLRHAGLGLNMVSAFVEQSSGLLTVGSVPGKGTWFDIFLPAMVAAADRIDSDAINSSESA